MENIRFAPHQHKWRELVRNPSDLGDGGYVACECGDQEFLTEHELSEFRRERQLGMEPIVDEFGLKIIETER